MPDGNRYSQAELDYFSFRKRRIFAERHKDYKAALFWYEKELSELAKQA
jgi:hypothetical protein